MSALPALNLFHRKGPVSVSAHTWASRKNYPPLHLVHRQCMRQLGRNDGAVGLDDLELEWLARAKGLQARDPELVFTGDGVVVARLGEEERQ